MTPPKEHKHFSVTNPKEIKICDKQLKKSWIKETQWTTGNKEM